MTTSTSLWPAKYATFMDGLGALAAMTEDDLIAEVTLLPDDIRDRLAAGPLANRYACGICKAFGWGKDDDWDAIVAANNVCWRVYAYHEIPKVFVKRIDQLHYGSHANDIYERCIATYRAAGWTGDAQEANA